MPRFVYSLVRFVPVPAAGEFVNVGVIVGSEETGEWSTRHVQNDRRGRDLAASSGISVATVYDFLERLGDEIDRRYGVSDAEADAEAPSSDLSEGLDEKWLQELHRRSRNIVQLSPPAPLEAVDAEAALDLVFDFAVADPARSTRYRSPDKRAVRAALRTVYRKAGLPGAALHERCKLASGGTYADMDFVVSNGRALQLAHTYSFGIASQTALSSQVKAWGWTVGRLRRTGGTARFRDGTHVDVPSDVDIEVVYSVPEVGLDSQALSEAQQVFQDIAVAARDRRDTGAVVDRALVLWSRAHSAQE